MATGDIRKLIDMIKDQDGPGSGLDADLLRGFSPSTTAQPNTIPVTTESGKLHSDFVDVSGTVTKPNVSGPTSSKYGKDITLNASGSVTAFADNGAVIQDYYWTLPDNTTTTGNSITYNIPNDDSLVGQTLTFKCYAKDTLGNKSQTVEHSVEITAGGAPDIDNIEWSESPPHHDNYSYTVTIHASDPDNDSLTYSVTCDDSNVTIEQDTGDPSKFNITYPDYTSDTTVTFTFTVSDGTYEVSEQQVIEVKDNIPPTIDQIVWDTNPPHYYGETHYVTIYATDPEGADLSYDLTCNDENVTIQQDGTNSNKFQVTYPNYTSDTTVTFTFHVSDGTAETAQDQNVLVKANKPPVINGWTWSGSIGPNGEHYENQSYDLTIDADDPENDTLSYEVTCDDNNVTIQQDGTNPNVFHITYPDYSADTNVTFTISVSDTANHETTQTDEVLVKITLPIGDTGVIGKSSLEYLIISIPSNTSDFGDLTASRFGLTATSNGINDRGVFGGGYHGNIIDYVTISTPSNAHDFGDLTIERYSLAATSNGTNNRGVFGGGAPSTNIIDYITISNMGNAHDFGDLTISRPGLAATSNGTNNRGVFGGGSYGATEYSIIEYITISTLGNAQNFGNLTIGRGQCGATSNGINDRGIFGGGRVEEETIYRINVIDYITISNMGNAHDFGDLTISRSHTVATSNGPNDRGVFCGGYDNSETDLNVIDYVTISNMSNALDFGDLIEPNKFIGATSNA